VNDDDYEDEPPLSEDDILIQRYLDGTLEGEELIQTEFRIDEDAAFGRRIAAYSSMFAALDREGGLRTPAPLGIAEAAVAAWAPSLAAAVNPARGLADLFGGLRGALAVFVAADLVLASLIAGLMVTRGPVHVIKDWVLSIKDVTLYLASVAPGSDQLAVVLPVVTLTCLAALFGVFSAGRRVYARTEYLR
jgi:anti-sigma-K factor RskA